MSLTAGSCLYSTTSMRSRQVEPSKGSSSVFEGKYCHCFSGGGRGMMGKIPHQLQCLSKGSEPLAIIRPILPWNVPGSTSLRPDPLRQFFFLFVFLRLSFIMALFHCMVWIGTGCFSSLLGSIFHCVQYLVLGEFFYLYFFFCTVLAKGLKG